MEFDLCCFWKILGLFFLILVYIFSSSGQWLLVLILKFFPYSPTVPLYQRFGKWAIITGASDGIGEALAKDFYKKGMNLFLISRNELRLNEAKERIQRAASLIHHGNPPEIRTFVFDFSSRLWNEEKKDKLKQELEILDIGILINNVGLAYPSAQTFDELHETFLEDLLSVNIRSAFCLTRIVLPGMRQRQRGAIICVGSGAGSLPSEPLYAGYAAVKAALSSFCNSLKVELVKDSIVVQCHTPLLITTKLSKIKRTSLTVLSCERYSRDAITALERDNRLFPYWVTATCCPSLIHTFILIVASHMIPLGLWNRVRLSQTMEIRRRYLNKKH